jgi:FAD/FMN-containing dehydrogenase
MTVDTRANTLTTDLAAQIRGRVIGPNDNDYDTARMVMPGGFDRHPAAIARVADADDVAKVIRFARERELPISVRCGGHSATAAGVIDDGLVIDVRDLTGIDLDTNGRTVWAGAGLEAVQLSKALGEHGLAVGFGDTGSVGIGGITLGGGLGYLARKFGLTIDNLLAAEVVTADGEIREVDVDHEPDLFWALRGAGANFGVTTRFKYRVADVPAFTGGFMVLPATAETVHGFIKASENAPVEVTTIANVMPCPPLPFVSPDVVGQLVIFGIVAVAAPDDEAARLLAPFRAIAEPLADMVNPIPYPNIYPPEDESYHPLAVSKNLFIDGFDRATAEGVIARLEANDAAMRAAQIRVYGGAVSLVPNDATAYAHRDRPIMVNIAIFYEGEHDRAARAEWVDEFSGWLAGDDQAAYVNFLADEGEARIRAAYPHGAYERLAAIKRRYDPDNVFRSNQNIPPA